MAFILDGKTLQQGVAFTDKDGNQYPANWLQLASLEEKEAIGITEIADPVLADDRFYWSGDINNPKEIDDKEDTSSDGEVSITKGLKSQFIAQIKDTTNKLLAQSDWYVIRKLERNIDIPTDIADKRSAIITESNRLETAISAATDIEDFITAVNSAAWPSAE